MREPMTDAVLDTLIGHAEYGHFEGQDYDAVETLVAEVRRLRAEVAGADENVASWQGIAADLREERDHLQAEVRQLRTECEEVEYQLHGGTDVDGPVSRGLDGLDLPGKANAVHSTAVDALIEVYELRAAIREHD